MPIQYTGVLEEHRACRTGAVVFDVSHLGSVRVAGAGAFAAAAVGVHQRPRRIGPGRAQYTHLLDPGDAHVVDDIIVWWVDDERVPRDAERVEHRPPRARARRVRPRRPAGRSTVADITSTRAVLAVQGPEARAAAGGRLAEAAAGAARFAVRGRDLRRRAPGAPPAPATPARTASSSTSRAGAASDVWHARPRRRGHPGRARRPRHAAARGRAPAARPRARTGDHAAPGRARLGRPLRQGRLPGPDAARWPSRTGASPAGCAGSPSTVVRSRVRGARCSSTARRSGRSRAATSRPCSSTGSRSRSSRPHVEDGRRRRASTSAAARSPATVVEAPVRSSRLTRAGAGPR